MLKCVNYGLANNLTIRQNDFQSQLAEVQFKQSKNAFLPTASASLSPGVSFGRSPVQNAFVYTNQAIFNNSINTGASIALLDGKVRKNTVTKDELDWKSALAQNDKLKNDIALTIAGLYLQALLSKQQIKIAELQLQQSNAQLSTTRKMVNVGTLPELNAAELEAQVAKDSLNVVLASQSFLQAVLALKNYMSLDPATAFDIETPPADKIPVETFAALDPAIVYELALKNQPQFKVNAFKLQAAQTNLLIAKAGLRPRLWADIGLSSGFSRVLSKTSYTQQSFFDQIKNNFRQYIGLNVSVPLFDAFNTRSNIARSKLNIGSQQLGIEQDKLALKQDIYKAHLDAVTAFQKFNAAGISVKAAERSLSFAEKRYNVGMLGTLDLITNQNNLFRAKQEYVLSQYDYVFKMKVLEFYKGMGLKL